MRFKDILVVIIFSLSVQLPGVAQEAAILEYGARVNTIAYSPGADPPLIAAAGTADDPEDNIIKVWDLRNNRAVELRGHTGAVRSVAFSPNGELLASGSHDWTFRLWDGLRPEGTIKHHVVDGVRSAVEAVAFSPDGLLLATAGTHVIVWNLGTMEEMFTLRHTKYVWTVAFSPDGRYLAAGEGDGEGPGLVRVWDLATQKQTATLDGDAKIVYSVVFSPDNQTLASGGWSGQIRLWSVSDWQLLGTIREYSTIYSLDFAPDSKILAAAGFGFLSLWSAESGRVIASLAEQADGGEVVAVAFSNDGVRLASGGSNGNVRIRNIETHLQAVKQDEQRAMVRLIHFSPKGYLEEWGGEDWLAERMAERIDLMISESQLFFAEQMESYGHGRKTFTYETDATGKALVRKVIGQFDDAHYHEDPWGKIWQEIGPPDEKHVDVVFVHGTGYGRGLGIGAGTFTWGGGGRAIVHERATRVFAHTAHELGHAFGLAHDFRHTSPERWVYDHHIMSFGSQHPKKLSKCAAEWLDVHPMFNDNNQTGFNEPMTIDMVTAIVGNSPQVTLFFEIDDADGLHHAMLLGQSEHHLSLDFLELRGCQVLSGERQIIKFVTQNPRTREVTLRVIDAHGRFWQETFPMKPKYVKADVNRDGMVSILDLVAVASSLRQTGQNPADVNGDGVVDILDLVLVAGAFEMAHAAPSITSETFAMLTAAEVEDWIAQARKMALTDPVHLRGIGVLEQLVAALSPAKTVLLPNYPNPFNPETWIPYELATDSDVRIAIFDVHGAIVRRLHLGHQRAGYYAEKDRAVYWDGRNGFGERVASGLYFYTLTTSGFSATRKMLIGK